MGLRQKKEKLNRQKQPCHHTSSFFKGFLVWSKLSFLQSLLFLFLVVGLVGWFLWSLLFLIE